MRRGLFWGGRSPETGGEKVVAAMAAANILMAGGSHGDVIARYRELVAGHTHRLMS